MAIPHMPDEPILREKAREAVRQGKLPTRPPDRIWGCGPGVGVECPVCGLPVTKGDLEFEIEFARGDFPGLDTFHVHTGCFAAWELERNTA